MSVSNSPTAKKGYWPIILGLLSLAVVSVLACLAYLLLTLPRFANRATPTTQSGELNLPTAAPATATPGPPLPSKAVFVAEEPIEGFSDCDVLGVKGMVQSDQGKPVAGVQVVLWGDQVGLLALDTTDTTGGYFVKIQARPDQARLWVQVYQDDIAVSVPLSVTPQIDCHNGFQIYQINWHELPEQDQK